MATSSANFLPHDVIINQNAASGVVKHTRYSSDEEDESESDEEKILKKEKYIRANWFPPPHSSFTIREIAVSLFDYAETDTLLPVRKVKLCERILKQGDVVKRIGSKDDHLGYCRSTSVTCYAQVVGTDYVLTNVNSTDLRPLKWGLWICWTHVFYVMKVIFTLSMISFQFHLYPLSIHSLIMRIRRCVTIKDSYNAIPLDEWKANMTAGLKQSPTRRTSHKTDSVQKKVVYNCFAFCWILTSLSDIYQKCGRILSIPFGVGLLGSFFEFYLLMQICIAVVQSTILKKMKLESVICFYSICGITFELCFKLQLHAMLDEKKMSGVEHVITSGSGIYLECLGIFILCYCSYRTFMVLKTMWRKGLPRSIKDLADLFSGRWERELFPGKLLMVNILNTQTRVEVVWQDGTVEHDVLSVDLQPVSLLWDNHEFFPGDRVLHSNDSVTDVRSYEYGVVIKVDHRSRTAIVKWLKMNSEGENPKLEVLSVEEMSVYDINHHPHFKYFALTDAIADEVLEPTAEDNANEGDPITTDQSPPEDNSLLPQGEGADQEMNGGSDLCTAPPTPESENCAILKSSLPSELATEADEEQPIGAEKQSENEGRNKTTDKEPQSRTDENLVKKDTKQVVNTKLEEDVKQEENTKHEDDTMDEVKMKQEDDTEQEDAYEEKSQGQGLLLMLGSVPDSHKFKLNTFEPKKLNTFLSIVKKEIDILKSSLPDGTVVKSFEDRIDLYSVLIKGPKMTPYEDGLFFFDFQLPSDYPESPPLCHYVSFCAGPLNPNLHEGGRVCVSLLGTWPGKDTEKWNKDTSTLLQVIVSIQGLILVSEPYYNEPVFLREKGTQLGKENSRLYNEMVVLRIVEAIINLIENPPDIFQKEISDHFATSNLVERLEGWVDISESCNSVWATASASLSTSGKFHGEDAIVLRNEIPLPDFPLMPASKGFCLSLRKSLDKFKNIVASQKKNN